MIAAEGSIEIGSLDGYNGTLAADGAHVLTQTNVEGTVPGIRLEFIQPVSAVGSYVGVSSQARSIDRKGIASGRSVSVQAFDPDGNEVGSADVLARLYGDFDNAEAFWTIESADANIGSVIILMDEEPTAGQSILVDQITFARPIQTNDGDFNGDGQINVDDIDLLCAAAQLGNPSNEDIAEFDMTSDAQLDEADIDFWLAEIAGTVRGDLDLNGKVEFADFLTFSGNFGQDDATWSMGDFDCDGSVGFADFLWLSQNFGFGS